LYTTARFLFLFLKRVLFIVVALLFYHLTQWYMQEARLPSFSFFFSFFFFEGAVYLIEWQRVDVFG